MPIPSTHLNPISFMGIASLMRKVAGGMDLLQAINLTAYDPDDANMLMGMAVFFLVTGNKAMADELQLKALQRQQIYCLSAGRTPEALRLLVIMRPGDMTDNTPVDFLVESLDVVLMTLYIAIHLPLPPSLPEHDVLFIAIAQSDQNQPLLQQIQIHLHHAPSPTLNFPERIDRLSRQDVSAVLSDIPELQVPRTLRCTRLALQRVCLGIDSITSLLPDGDFPVIVRPLQSQGGTGLARIADTDALHAYLERMAENAFYLSRFVDYRSGDGFYRKYRIAFVEGVAYACHLAIADHWMVHYKTSGMADDLAKRQEEAHFLQHFDDEFGQRHARALRLIATRLGMDYLVMDCAEAIDGSLLFFEADNVGFVHASDDAVLFAYKQAPMAKVFMAFDAMLHNARRSGVQQR